MALDIDRHFRREDFKRYAMQCGLAGFVVFILLLVLDTVTQTVLIAALGASAFIAFAVPRSLHSGPRHMIGGYVVGIVSHRKIRGNLGMRSRPVSREALCHEM